jgi:hypothetical protein
MPSSVARVLRLAAALAPCAAGCAAVPPAQPPLDRWTEPAMEEPAGAQSAGDTAAWPYWPQRMRVHPLSQLVTDRDSGRLLIEARLEFLDAEGHSAKAVGQVLIDLLSRDDPSAPIASWSRDLADRAANRDHFDDLTRTYLFRLEFDAAALPREPRLQAYYRSSQGRVLKALPYDLRR